MAHQEIQNGKIEDWQAASVLALAKEHKKNCNGDCGISLYILYLLYYKLKGEGALQDIQHFL